MKQGELSFRGVTIRYNPDADAVIKGISFGIESPERVALVGLNGTGKTTLLMSAVGLLPYEGEIHVCGELLTRKTLKRIRTSIGFLFNVPEDQLLFPTALEDVAFGLLHKDFSKAEAFEKAREMLVALDMEQIAGSSIHQLSHGQKQRVALAGALVTNPKLLLLDEPTAGLDPIGRRHLASRLEEIDASMLIATHDLDFADSVCSRIIMLDGGEIAFDSPDTSEVRRRWKMSS